MSRKIKELYTDVGLSPPNGKGIHKEAFHRCVVAIKKKIKSGQMPGGSNAYAICMGSLTPKKAIKASHRR